MSDRGYFSGMSWHTEYHSLERKKEKTTDCKFLDGNRICKNGKSPCYMSKCFEATMCTYRIRERNDDMDYMQYKSKKITKQTSQKKIQRCSLPKGSKVQHATYGIGKLIDYDKEKSLVTIKFGLQQTKFKYPDAIEKSF